jgi:tellurite resistance protein
MLNDRGKESLLASCFEIAAVDGSVDERETTRIEEAGAALGMSPAHVKGVVLEAKERLGLA